MKQEPMQEGKSKKPSSKCTFPIMSFDNEMNSTAIVGTTTNDNNSCNQAIHLPSSGSLPSLDPHPYHYSYKYTFPSISVLESSSYKRTRMQKKRSQRNAIVAAATTLMLSLSLSANHIPLVSSFIISSPKRNHHVNGNIHLTTRLSTSSQSPSSSSSSSSSQLQMVSMTQRVIEKSSLGSTTTKRRRRRRPTSSTTVTTTTTTATSSANTSSNTKKSNVTLKRTRRSTSATKSKGKATTKLSSTANTSSTSTANNKTTDTNTMAKTFESLYYLPTYDEESKHWQDVVSILNSKILYDEDEASQFERLSSSSAATEMVTSSGSTITAATKPTTVKKTKSSKKQKRQTTTSSSTMSTSISDTTSSSSTKSTSRPSMTTLSKASKISTPNKQISTRTKLTTANNTKEHISRSSTMPGFLNNDHTRGHTSFRDGIRIVQKANEKSHSATMKLRNLARVEGSSKKRKKANSEAMYASSASVPDSLIAFTNEIHLEERITPKEEVILGTRTQEAIRLQRIYEALIEEYGREPSDDEWCAASGKINMEALQDAIQEGINAKNQLVTSNLRMVQGVVNLYIRNGLGSQYNAGDLMQEGTVALIRAAEKFEPERGFRFSTYAMYWIRAAVKRSQILQSRVINVPQRLHETHKKVSRLESQLKKELGRRPTDKELALASGITENQLERCRSAIEQQCFSLDAEIVNTLKPNSGEQSSETSYNRISAKYDDVEYRDLQSHFMKEDLVSTLRRYLSSHEVDLLLLRYGLMDERTLQYGFSGPLTIAEVSRLVGLKPDKVRRMINKSLRQLRHLIAHEWEDFESVIQRY